MSGFLPIDMHDMVRRGWKAVDFVLVTGDAYVDHPSFGAAVISRLLESRGYSVAIMAQPNIACDDDFTRFGRPRLGFLATGGNIDSMVAHYTSSKRRRGRDAYSPGGKTGKRPDRALIAYSRIIKRLYPQTPLIIGGLEASLRRFAHYDYWDDIVRPSILVDSGADLLVYGMGERQIVEIALRLSNGGSLAEMRDIRGICYVSEMSRLPPVHRSCASCEKVAADKQAYARAARLQLEEQDHIYGQAIVQKHGGFALVQTPPAPPLDTAELDALAVLPYERMYHPLYDAQGGVPAIEEVEFSIIHNRGCFGGCSFCSLAFHQGRHVTCRSEASVVREAELMTKNPRFKGYIHDVGGPTANFRGPACQKQKEHGVCKGKRCLTPTPCGNLVADHTGYMSMLRKLRGLSGVKRVFIRSGIRYDFICLDKNDSFLDELVAYHVSGQLKVAPEHCGNAVLDLMGKPRADVYRNFQRRFYEATKKAGKEQYLVPYMMSSHPGSTLKDAIELALFLKEHNIRPEQVQDFYPTPGTASTCMYYTGIDPFSMKPVYVPRGKEERRMQRALLQYYKDENRETVKSALHKAGRADLIGSLVKHADGHGASKNRTRKLAQRKY